MIADRTEKEDQVSSVRSIYIHINMCCHVLICNMGGEMETSEATQAFSSILIKINSKHPLDNPHSRHSLGEGECD